METIEIDTLYGPARDEIANVPTGMEAFGPELVAEPLTLEEMDATAADALRRLWVVLRG